MSVKVISWVWDHSQAKSAGDRLTLLAIADSAEHDGDNAYPGLATLAAKTHLSRAQVIRCIDRLKALGELEVRSEGGGRGRRTVYRVVMKRSQAVTVPQAPKESQDATVSERETVAFTGGNSRIEAGAYKEETRPDPSSLPPTVVAADAARGNGHGELVPLRSARAAVAANGVFGRLKAEVDEGRRSWSWSDAAKAEWVALLDDDRNLEAARQFLMWIIAEMRGHAVTTADMTEDERQAWRHDWAMCRQKVLRHRSLALYGVDQALTRGLEGQPFWNYVEAVCQRTRAEVATGGGAS